MTSLWTSADDTDANVAWTRSVYDSLQPYLSDGGYLNDVGDQGTDRVRSAYESTTYDRLADAGARGARVVCLD